MAEKLAEEFTGEEKELLKPYVTSLDKPIFCLVNLPEVVKGALFSRYSRSEKNLRRTLLEEFIQKPESGFKEIIRSQASHGTGQFVAVKKAEDFYERVLIGFGDDSIAELGGASIACEGISNIATKAIEDSRIGLSYLEKSTRYVRFDDKVDGKYRFYEEPLIMQSKFADDYLETCNLLFETYANFMGPVLKYVSEVAPRDGSTSERAYQSACRAKACDILRGLLPAATTTNVGVSGNGRAFEYLLTKLYANPLAEMQSIASSMHTELKKVIPSFVKRPSEKHGKEMQAYIRETDLAMQRLASTELAGQRARTSGPVTLVSYDANAEAKIISAMLYSHSSLPMQQLVELVEKMPVEKRKEVIHEYMARRTNRRHKPGRAAENIHYTFDMLANYGAYRDLHRHRMLTQERQDLTANFGYDTPKELTELGLAKEFNSCMGSAKEAFQKIFPSHPKEAQYVVPMAYRLRWYATMSLREAYYFTELRSSQHGHRDYRKIAQQMFAKVKEVHPSLVEYAKFIDMNDYALERLASEKQIDRKADELQKKYKKD